MKFTKNISLFSSGILGSLFLLYPPAYAAILVEPIITTANKNFPNGETLGANFQPLINILGSNAPDAGNQDNLLNDTGYTINKLSLLLLTQFDLVADDVFWGDVNGDGKIGISNIFSNITIASDLALGGTLVPRLDLTGGTISNGKRFTIQFLTSPDLTPINSQEYGPLVTGFFYDGFKSVPEPSNLFAFAFAITIAIWSRKSKAS
ncbi:PEP-CTERM sorting domain-containing protein [Nostoc sp. ChiQUE01b]|uniref:PEP-CTERM sorting domain-containing protein n=1 Tax=Nostoc sp. ChiQUE01b TaxID=3075376 RepID=UPI002AD2FE6E|nr:PEP-CTERM sorting domain-containing protein [Nostoc sp. ChiQUE01b]MDZ8258619.1 PEP-CTERM sorting domain-containing protein [Nostoc sp. ChiQUE01b]